MHIEVPAVQVKELIDQPAGESSTAIRDRVNQSITRLGLSARAYHRILKIALTIADLAEAESLSVAHVAEAVQYRRMQYEF